MRAAGANILLGAISLAYPLLALFLIRLVSPVWLVAALVVALLLRLVVGGKGSAPPAMIFASLAAVTGIAITAVFDQELSLRLYPVFMNLAVLSVFGWSLVNPPSMIERFARLVEPDLPQEGVTYTRKVTQAWCIFFLINISISLWTVFRAGFEIWALYNGAIAYGLMGLMFAGEFLVRRRVKSRFRAEPE